MTTNTWSYRSVYLLRQFRIVTHLFENGLFLLSVGNFSSVLHFLDSHHIHVALSQMLSFKIVDQHNSGQSDPVSWYTHRHVSSIYYQTISPGHLTGWNILRKFLDFKVLWVNHFRFRHGYIRVFWAFLVVSLLTITIRRNVRRVTRLNLNILDIVAALALNFQSWSFNERLSGANDDTTNNEQFRNHVTLDVSDFYRMVVAA